MMVFVLFLMYQERQYEEAALRAQSQVEGQAESEDEGFGTVPRGALGEEGSGGPRTTPGEMPAAGQPGGPRGFWARAVRSLFRPPQWTPPIPTAERFLSKRSRSRMRT